MVQPADQSVDPSSTKAKAGTVVPTESKSPAPPVGTASAPETTAAVPPKAPAQDDAEPGPKPAVAMLIPEGTAPKAAEWKVQAAREEWCPPMLASKYPELKRHVYE